MRAFAAVFLATAALVTGFEVVDIMAPQGLKAHFPSGINERPALFGIPPLGSGSITGLLLYPNAAYANGCASFAAGDVPGWPQGGVLGVTIILMLDRGGNCTFVTKVSHAEAIGINAVIVADNVVESVIPYMADDGQGQNIEIPSMMISMNDANIIKDCWNTSSPNYCNTSIMVTMSWGVPHPDNIIQWRLWTTTYTPPGSDEYNFKKNFATAVGAIDESHQQFTPYFSIIDGRPYGCTVSYHPCGKQCTNGGRYCAIDPEHDLYQGLDGEDVIHEDLIQYCLHTYLGPQNRSADWWKYVSLHRENCGNNDSTWNQNCSYAQMLQIGVSDFAFIETCMNNSVDNAPNGPFGDYSNTVFDSMLTNQNYDGIFLTPRIFVNDDPYNGRATCPEPINIAHCGPLQFMCAGFKDPSIISACSYAGCNVDEVMDFCGVCCGGSSGRTCNASLDCNGVCAGGAYHDSCGTCVGGTTGKTPNYQRDCDGVCFGAANYDSCHICSGGNTGVVPNSSKDCNGMCFGSAYRDDCNVCAGGQTGKIPNGNKDCTGTCFGTATLDACHICSGGTSGHAVNASQDCMGVCSGAAFYDDCKVCSSGRSGHPPNSDKDCRGVCFGNQTLDVCGVCGGSGLPCTGSSSANNDNSGGKNVIGITLGVVIPLLLLIGIGGYCYLRRQRRNMRMDVDRILQSYMPIDDANQMIADRRKAEQMEETGEVLMTTGSSNTDNNKTNKSKNNTTEGNQDDKGLHLEMHLDDEDYSDEDVEK